MIDMYLQYPSRLLGLQMQFTQLQSVLFGVVGTPGHIVSNQGTHLTTVKSDLGYY